MTLTDFLDGVAILRGYFDNQNGYHLAAEHDVVYVAATDRPVEAGDLKLLGDLGWLQEGTKGVYSPNEPWAAYV